MSVDVLLNQRINRFPLALEELRLKAESALRKTGIPSRKNEDWRYAPLTALREQNYHAPVSAKQIKVTETAEHIKIEVPFGATSVDGGNTETLKRMGLEVRVPVEQDAEYFDLQDVSFSAQLNQAIAGTIVLLKVSKAEVQAKPVEIIYSVESNECLLLAASRVIIVLGEGASLNLSEELQSDVKGLLSIAVKVVGGSSATLQMLQSFKTNQDCQVIHYLDATLDQDASLKDWSLSLGGGLHRFEGMVKLCGRGSSADLKSLTLLAGREVTDYQLGCDHRAPNTTSRQLFKSVLSDSSRSIFNGRIDIQKSCFGVDSRQMNKTLLLSDKAEVDTKPQLEVANDDVKAGHGAAVGRLNQEEIFYLASRAIEPKLALSMLLRAFLDDILLNIPPALGSDKCSRAFSEKVLNMKAEEVISGLSN